MTMGVIFCQCDEREMAYLKIVMDGVYGRDNYFDCVTVKTKEVSGFSSGTQMIFKVAEYILIYQKDRSYALPKGYKVDKGIVRKYSITTESYNRYFKRLDLSKKTFVANIRGKDYYRIDDYEMGFIKDLDPNLGEGIFVEKFDTIFSRGKFTKRAYTADLKKVLGNGLFFVSDIAKSGKNKGSMVDMLIYNAEQICFLKESSRKVISGSSAYVMKTEYISNVWTDISWSTVSEGGIIMPNGRKPEKLLHRIFDLATEKGDLVLDFFLGSGTTCAVAHKMGRQYIGIECMDYIEDIAIKRLRNVIAGDNTGASREANWLWGGSFVYGKVKSHSESGGD